MKNFLPLLDPVTVNDYPYGFNQRTSITYQIEYKKGKGYRILSTTINPKTDKPNKPKASTYSSFRRLYRDTETNHIKSYGFNPYDIEGYETALASGLFEGITPDIYDHKKIMARVVFNSIKWECTYVGMSINWADPKNPVTPKTLTPEQLESLKLIDYETNKKILQDIRSTESK